MSNGRPKIPDPVKRAGVLCHARSFVGDPRLLSDTRISDQAPQ